MIEPTDEMEQAFDHAAWEHPVEFGGLEMANVRAGLAAVLAIVERDYDVTPRPCQWCGTPPGHHYLSTGCLHGEHDYCRCTEGQTGPKTPGVCKFCAAPCQCACHGGTS